MSWHQVKSGKRKKYQGEILHIDHIIKGLNITIECVSVYKINDPDESSIGRVEGTINSLTEVSLKEKGKLCFY